MVKSVRTNACAHRGHRICTEERGHTRLVCPYHRWTYDYKADDIRTEQVALIPDFSLKPVHVGIATGYIYVCRVKTPDFENFKSSMEPCDPRKQEK